MKKFLALLLVLLLLTSTALASSFQLPTLSLPEDSTQFSPAFAMQALTLCQADVRTMATYGMIPIFQDHFDKPLTDASHTSAYLVCQGMIPHKGEMRTLMVVVVRGTTGGEWYSNFDCAPSQSNDTPYAENFYAAALDIYQSTKPLFAQAERPLILLTGYSRGAACANLLGMMVNADYPVEDVYVYTGATPNTVRGEAASTPCPNIFNIVNPCDVITCLPPAAWGYTRLGQDIVLPADEAALQQLQLALGALTAIAPDIASYYTVRHSLTGPGTGDAPAALTAYELMLRLADLLSGTADQATVAAALGAISPQSDLAPLVQLFTAADETQNPFAQHMPNVYLQLFTQLQMPKH